MKDLEWLKEEVESLRELGRSDLVKQGIDIAVTNTLYLIDQVEQPNPSNSTGLELPVIPDYVAEYILNEKEGGFSLKQSLNNASDYALQSIGIVKKTADYLGESHENFEKYVKSYLFGYTVEEKKYWVMNRNKEFILKKKPLGGVQTTNYVDTLDFGKNEESKVNQFMLTKQEIKDFDPRYMAFAKEVEE